MARKRDTASKRLAKSIERNKSLASLRNLLRWTGPDPLGTTHEDAVLRKAFEAFGFDPRDPGAWRILLVELASVHFDGVKRRGGRKPKWNRTSWKRFKEDIELIDKAHVKNTGKYPTHKEVVDKYLLNPSSPLFERYKSFGRKALVRCLSATPTAVKNRAV